MHLPFPPEWGLVASVIDLGINIVMVVMVLVLTYAYIQLSNAFRSAATRYDMLLTAHQQLIDSLERQRDRAESSRAWAYDRLTQNAETARVVEEIRGQRDADVTAYLSGLPSTPHGDKPERAGATD